ncbi:putative serologically defined colon cancer antigen 1 protein [Botrytis fragariae]|uniref:Ribosome quality control complex subunit 2 n=1 Tax=Botrytis fragariae TaxID=1964551 RepID=A0A8H6B1K9_9HELO|nr:putative serologically defined colon cancer antigen 1 protein [Botrytis fragariae]KAF5877719.1 putative serologically defined colon cancer antigen 1 protein [Botrytis fragariae]
MKQRFSSIDVKVIAHELSNALVTLRVSNIYDLSSKIFLIKFAKPDNKQQILIDSGFRCHLTDFSRATAAAPSIFVQRLRKYLKTRRVTQVSQIGTDRIIEFQFSDGQYRLYLEFYAGGNIILTDKELNILTLLRVVDPGEAQEELRVGLKYSLDNRQNYGGIPDLTKERLQEALQKGVDKGEDDSGKKKKKPGDALRKALAVSITEFPPMLVDHAMRITNFNSSLKPAEVLQSEDLLDHLMKSLQEAQRVVQEITSSETAKGYIVAKKKDPQAPSDEDQTEIRKGLLYDDFHPFKPKQFQDDPSLVFLEFEGFNKTVDEFFSSIEGQKLESKLEEREKQAQKKIQAARNEQAKRLGGLQEIQALNERKAGALQANIERVQEVTDAVNGLIAQGMDWFEIGRLIEREQKFNNPVASMIKLPLKLEENTVTILLNEEAFDEDEDSTYETDSDVSESEDEDNIAKTNKKKEKVSDTRIPIDIDLALSPWANARNYFDQKRSAASKEDKTLQSSSKALKSTEAKIAQDLKKGLKQEKAILRPVRKQMWFEKFIWFISSDGYLVLAGKDAQQSEILYKRYLKKGDIYLHADIRGAASVIVRNNPKTPDAPIPPQTLSQAGTLVVVTSSAWDSKAGMSAWWVTADQVSKSAPTGEFLPAGSFNTHGKKNFLPPAQLLLGFGVLFQISDESKARHVKHRLQDDSPSSGTTTDAPPAGDSLLDDEGSGDELNQSDEDEPSPTKEVEADHQDVDDSDDEDADSKPNPLQGEVEQPDEVATQEKLETLQIDDKKPQPSGSEPQVEESDEDSVEELQSQSISTGKKATPAQNPPKKGPAPAKRGKKGKAKKIAQKYKDQDEEDRIAAQEIIGAAAGQEKAEAEAKAKAAREAELAFQKERRRAQHQRTQKETAEHEEMRKLMLEDGIDTHEDNEIETMTLLDSFVGLPLPGDEILEAIPVCAPWAAMGKYKYKAKIQPGAQKKGKAVREILGKWMAASAAKGVLDESSMDVERIWPREMDLIKGWKPEETTNVVPVGKVRVMMGGGSAAAKAKGDKGKSSGGRGGRGSKKK